MVDETKSNEGSRINRLPSAYIKPVEIQVQPTGSESTFEVPQLGKATSTEPSVINNAEPDNTVTLGESFVAGLAPTGRDIGEALYSKMHFDVDPIYNPDDDFKKFEDTYNGTRNPQEIQLLLKSRSVGEFQYNTERILDLRDRQDKQAANPISGAVGGVFDIDAPIAIASGGVGAAVKVGVGATRTISATTAGVSMAALNSATVNQSYRTDTDRLADVLVATAGGAFAVRNPKPLTTPLTPTSPNSVVSTAAILPEEAVVSQSIPKPVLPDGTVISPLPTSTITNTTSPNLAQYNYGLKPSATDTTLVETRGTGVRFHGTSTPLPNDIPTNDGVFRTSPSNIYGEGFYTTEAVDIAKGYTGKGKGGAPTLYKVEERGDIPVYDLDQPITPDIQRLVDNTFKGVLDDVAEDYDLSTLSKVFDAVRAESSTVGWSKYDVQDAFFSIRVDLEAQGYRGLTHTGGAKTGNDAHNVKIYWYPEDDLIVTRSDLAEYTVPKTTGAGVNTQYQLPSTTTTVMNPSGSGVLKQTQLSQAQLLDDLVEAEIQSISAPTPSTIASIPVGSSRINLSSPLQGDGTEMQFPKLSIENRYAAAVQSAADDMFHYTKGDPNNPLNYILASPYTSGDDAVSHGVAVLRDGEFRLVDFEQSIVRATKELHGTGGLTSRLFQRDHNQALKQTSMDIYTEMQKLDQVVIAHQKATGEVLDKAAIISLIDDTTNPDVIKASMKSYIDSDFAVNMYDHIKRVGMMDEDALEQIVRRPTYMPVKQSYDQVKNFIEGDLVDVAKRRVVVAKFLGDQIFDMYNGLKQGIRKADGTTIRLTSHQLGEKFLDNMKARAQNPNTVQTVGLPKEELHDILTRQGVDPDEASALVNKMTEQRSNQQGVANLRQRIAWDFNKTATTPDGVTFSMRDLVDQNSFQNVVDYNRRMSKRVGLAQYGFKDRNALQTAKADMLDNLPEGANRAKATAYIDNVINAALGNPVGEAVPDWVRSMNTIAGSILLSGSGLYNAIEAGVQIQRIGMLRSFPQLLTGMKPMFRTVSSYSKAEATTLHDALLGKLMSTDRWQNIMTHYSDDFSIEGGFHEAVQYYGQSTRFLNGSEHIKRWQLGMFAGVFVDAFRGASKGLANDVKFLKEGLKFSDELLDKTTAQFKLHGDNIDGWDADIRIAMEQKVFHEADNLAHTVHHGEVPSFMEYSSVGKIIFPFMRYLFAMHQKILRRTYIRDGAAGIAMVLAVQFPLAMMVANTKRAMSGEKPYDLDNPDDLRDFMRSTVNGLSGLGTFSYPLDVILSGGQNMGSVVTLAPVGRVLGMGEDIITGNADLTTIKEGTPANTILAINLLYAALNDEE